MGLPVDECKEKTTSTQFIQWNELLDDEEWLGKPSRLEHQVASVAQEVHRIALMLQGKGKLPTLDEFLIKFQSSAPAQSPEKPLEELLPDGTRWKINPPKLIDLKDIDPNNGIEMGQPLDEKWQKINDYAKMEWMSILGPSAKITQRERHGGFNDHA